MYNLNIPSCNITEVIDPNTGKSVKVDTINYFCWIHMSNDEKCNYINKHRKDGKQDV